MKEFIRSRLRDLSSVFSVDDWKKHCAHLLEENDWQNERIEQLEKALRVYADCALCKEGIIAYPTGVEHSGVQEIGFDPCDCLIARQALGKEE